MEDEKSVGEEKEEIRRDMLSRLKNQPAADKITKSSKIKNLALKGPFFKKAAVVMFYAATSLEADTSELIRECLQLGKKVALPVADPVKKELIPVEIENIDSLVRSSLGIMEPARDKNKIIPLAQLDLVVVPGLAFDKWGNRLGRGAGYYDCFLAKLPARTVKVGLAFDFQMIDSVPTVDGQDIPLDLVISG